MAGRKPNTPKTGGRKKGTPNKTTASVKAALECAFTGMGGKAALTRWAKENPGEFYKIWAKLLPKEISAEVHQTTEGRITIYLPDNGRGKEAKDA